MQFKHQLLFAELSITEHCPPNDVIPIDSSLFRWVFDPITHEHNFLPNYPLDKIKQNTQMYFNGQYSKPQLCRRCSQSFYVTLEAAKISFSKRSKMMKSKLGYTHIASGPINKEDGLGTKPTDSGHISFFENENCVLVKKFQICAELDKD